MIRILHISADFPDAFVRRKTKAVRNLVEGTPAFRHNIYSINRISGLGGVETCGREGNVTTLVYRAPPFGLLLRRGLAPLADWIIRDMVARGQGFDMIHAHKLTIEGLIAHRIARTVGCPYVCTVRGNTDQRYIRMKPGMRRHWRKLANDAAWLFPVTPWIDHYLSRTLALETANRSLLPTVTKIDRFLTPRNTAPRLVTAFHLAGWRLKGMPNLLAALAQLRRAGRPIYLDILGEGPERETLALTKEIQRHSLADHVRLCGAVPHEQISDTLNGYTAFVLPTLRETFGMVYIEALFAGVPILYSSGRGVDGFFKGQNVGIRCNPNSVSSIADGLSLLMDNAEGMKREIARLQTDGSFDQFCLNTVCRDYAAQMTRLVTMPGTGGNETLNEIASNT